MQRYRIAFRNGSVMEYEYAGSYAGHELIWASFEDVSRIRQIGTHLQVFAQRATSSHVAVSAQEFRFAIDKYMAMVDPSYGMNVMHNMGSMQAPMFASTFTTSSGTSNMSYTPIKSEKQKEKEKKEAKHNENIKKLITHRKNHENRQATKS